MSDNEPEMIELDAHERRLFAALPRDMAVAPHEEDSVVRVLHEESYFRQRVQLRWPVWVAVAAAVLVTVALGGGIVGGRLAMRTSLEAMIGRSDLSIADRILVLQRAGSAYVQAAHAYADATAKTDSSAVEVAQQVLRGAAHAVVRSRLDGGMASRLTAMLQDSTSRPVSRPAPVIWY